MLTMTLHKNPRKCQNSFCYAIFASSLNEFFVKCVGTAVWEKSVEGEGKVIKIQLNFAVKRVTKE